MGVIVNDSAVCGSGGDGGSSARRRQRDRIALVGLHRGIAGDVDGDELADLTGREADRPGRQRGAGEIGSGGGIAAAAGDGVGRRRCAGGVARAGDRERERRAAAVALGLACTRRRDCQRRVVVNDSAGCGSGGDGGASARRRQRDPKALVGLHRGIAGDVDGDELADLTGREADRPGRQRGAGEIGSGGGIAAAAGDGVGRRRCAGGVARAGDRERERCAAAVALGLACIRRRDRQRRVVVNDCAACGSGGDGGASARRRQRDSKALVGLHRGIAGDVDGDKLADLTGREADRPGRQRGAGEVCGGGGIAAAAGDGVGRRRCAGGVARAGDRERERCAAAVALGLACTRRRDCQSSGHSSTPIYGNGSYYQLVGLGSRILAGATLRRLEHETGQLRDRQTLTHGYRRRPIRQQHRSVHRQRSHPRVYLGGVEISVAWRHNTNRRCPTILRHSQRGRCCHQWCVARTNS